MANSNSSPIYNEQSQIRNHDVELTIHDFDGTSDITLTSPDGESITVPSKFLDALGSVSHQALGLLHEQLDIARRVQNHPTSMGYDLLAVRHQHVWNSSQQEFRGPVWDKDNPLFNSWTCFCLADSDPNEDGTPYIEWMYHEESEEHGWALRLSGVSDVNISWAKWDDPAAIRESLDMLSDPESCVVVAGIVNAEATSQMTARRAAKALRSGRKLPGINMKKVKGVFAKHQSRLFSNSANASRLHNPSAKIVSLPSGDKRVPVAVAILPPRSFPNQAQLGSQRREMKYQDVVEFESKAYETECEPWRAQLVASFTAEGWRKIDLPSPTRFGYYRVSTQSPIYFTLIPENIWTDVSAGVVNFMNREFDLSRLTEIEKTTTD
jgi:hypothetical protein